MTFDGDDAEPQANLVATSVALIGALFYPSVWQTPRRLASLFSGVVVVPAWLARAILHADLTVVMGGTLAASAIFLLSVGAAALLRRDTAVTNDSSTSEGAP